MSEAWSKLTLGDAIELKRGYDLPTRDRSAGKVPVVSSSGITDYHSVAKVNGPGVVTGRYGTLGEVYYVAKDYWPLNTTLYVRDFKGNNPRFIAYFLRGLDFFVYSDKAAVPGLNRNHLHQAQISIPPLSEQRAIAHILGRLDDKIELNRRMNETLEGMARALFKAWFVDFEPVRAKMEGRWRRGQSLPGLPAHLYDLFPDCLVPSELGEIPEGWEIMPLDSIANFQNGLALQKHRPEGDDPGLPVVKIAQLRTGVPDSGEWASSEIKPECIIYDGDVVFSWSGTLMVRIWCGGTAALNQHLFKVSSDNYPKWFYLHWLLEHLPEFQRTAEGKVTTMGHIQRHHLQDAGCVVPPHQLVEHVDTIFSSLFNQHITRKVESKDIQALRDSLLPKLISGELRVNGE